MLVEEARECKKDKRKDAEDCFLAGLGKEGEGQGEERPMHYRVPVVSPFEKEKRKSRKENVERFDGHGAVLEHHRRLNGHEECRKECKQGLSSPGDNGKEHQQERKREHQAFGCENPVQVVAEDRHTEIVQERKPLRLEAVGLGMACQSAIVEFALIAGPGFLIVVHVLGDGHEDTFVALDAVTGFDLGEREG